jgi:iron complex transport system substrate-binding protein
MWLPGNAPIKVAPQKPRTVMYLRGSADLRAVAPGVGASEAFAVLDWQVLAPPGAGSFHAVTLDQIAALDPDEIVFADAKMRAVVAASDTWRGLRAVREHHAFVAPNLPFGWIEEPPSLNRLLAVAWLGRHGRAEDRGDAAKELATDATQFGSAVFGHAPTEAQLEVLAPSSWPLPP